MLCPAGFLLRYLSSFSLEGARASLAGGGSPLHRSLANLEERRRGFVVNSLQGAWLVRATWGGHLVGPHRGRRILTGDSEISLASVRLSLRIHSSNGAG